MSIQQKVVGFVFNIQLFKDRNTVADLSSFDSIEVLLKDPNGNLVIGQASVVDAVDGKIKYSTNSVDLEEFGLYDIQVRVEDSNLGNTYYSDIEKVRVERNLDS